ncbi:MAG: YoaK family protein [Burkholderiaceae bacterium]
MPVRYVRSLTSEERTARGDRHLGFALAFVAGAANAGAFLAVGIYTSHMTGLVSSIADHVALGHLGLALAALSAVLSFLLGAATSAIMIHYARRRGLRSQYALPLLFEALLLLLFGLLGASLEQIHGFFAPLTVTLLCYMMGLQNAVITKISGAVVRTTHLTGIITDLGIELGRLVYWNRAPHVHGERVVADRQRLQVLGLLCAFFLIGGVSGALGFKHLGFTTTIPLAAVLVVLSIVPVWDDLATTRKPG